MFLLLLLWFSLICRISTLPTSQDIGLCGLAQGLQWITIRDFPISYRGWTCSVLGYATSPCTWTGVICSGGNVVTLNLYYRGLTGSINSFIGKLTTLQALRIDVNSLNGTLATEIGLLTNLQYLGMSTNRFTGTIPSEIGNLNSLKYLLMYNNLVTGSIPSTICQLTNLLKFYPCDGNGQGCSPNSCIPNCLNYQVMASNYGLMPYCTTPPSATPTSIPTRNGSLPTTEPTTVFPPTDIPTTSPTAGPSLALATNTNQNLAMCSLQTLFVWTTPHFGWVCDGSGVAVGLCGKAGSRWTGVTCDAYQRVSEINLFNLGIKGTLPTQIGLLTGMSVLDLHHNKLYGTLPTHLGQLTGLQYLALSDNSFTGTIPTQLGLIGGIMSLYLFGNSLSGAIPSTFCWDHYLYKFYPCNGIDNLKCRDLTGCVPQCLSNVTAYNFASLVYCSSAPTVRPTPGPSAPSAIPTTAPSTAAPT